MRDPTATFNERVDGPKFIRAVLEFKDEPADLLYRLTNPHVRQLSQMQHYTCTAVKQAFMLCMQ
jgi:hypothetical protein